MNASAALESAGWSHWVAAMRPRTLTMALTPVIVGAVLAFAAQGRVLFPAVLTAAFAALCIQIATNLYNDVRDFERGGDGPDRLGPRRAAASGLLSAAAIKRAAAGFFAAAALSGLYLVWLGGWPILLLGALSILSGWAYSGGPKPISHTPFGEIFVVAFFGLGAVCGVYWLSAGELKLTPVLAGLALGAFAAAVLMVNNIRDAEADARAGRRTLAIVCGPELARRLFGLMMLTPFALLAPLVAATPDRWTWAALGALPSALALIRRIAEEKPGPEMNVLLAGVARAQTLFALLLCLGVLW